MRRANLRHLGTEKLASRRTVVRVFARPVRGFYQKYAKFERVLRFEYLSATSQEANDMGRRQ
jgi:hypothetical protein